MVKNRNKEINLDKITNSIYNLVKVLSEEGAITPSRWHTVEFYAKVLDKKAKGAYFDSLKVSSVKRELTDFSEIVKSPMKLEPIILKTHCNGTCHER